MYCFGYYAWRNKTLFAIAETYDFIITIPLNGKLEIRATAQDGSGQTSAFLGTGEIIPAPDVPRPDKIAMMKKMAKMKMKMGGSKKSVGGQNRGKWQEVYESGVNILGKW